MRTKPYQEGKRIVSYEINGQRYSIWYGREFFDGGKDLYSVWRNGCGIGIKDKDLDIVKNRLGNYVLTALEREKEERIQELNRIKSILNIMSEFPDGIEHFRTQK